MTTRNHHPSRARIPAWARCASLLLVLFSNPWSAFGGEVVVDNAEYRSIQEPLLSDPNKIQVEVGGSAFYSGAFTHAGSLWFMNCNLNTSIGGDPGTTENPEFWEPDEEILTSEHQRLSCLLSVPFSRCHANDQSVQYRGWVAAAIFNTGIGRGDIPGRKLLLRQTTCETLYSLGGDIEGLANGEFLTLSASAQRPDGLAQPIDDAMIFGNGAFAFFQQLPRGATYDVSLKATSPPDLSCSILGSSGTVLSDVDGINVRCTSGETHAVSGVVSNLAPGESVVLHLRLVLSGVGEVTDTLEVSENGPFTFDLEGQTGWSYDVSVLTHPLGQSCFVPLGGARLPMEPGDAVSVSCTEDPDGEGQSTVDDFFPDAPNPGMGGFLCDFWAPASYCDENFDLPWHVGGSGPRDLNCPTLVTNCVSRIGRIQNGTDEDGKPIYEFVEHIDCTAPGCTFGSSTVSPGVTLFGPQVGVISPRQHETVSGYAEVRLHASDADGVGTAAVFIDRQAIQLENVTVTGPPTDQVIVGYLPTDELLDGYHVLHAAVIDELPEFPVATGYGRSFRIDNQQAISPCAGSAPPTIAWDAPAAGSIVGGTVALSAIAQDDDGIARVELFADGVKIGQGTAPSSNGRSLFDWDTIGLQGSHTVRARAIDTCGLVASTGEIPVAIDNGLRVGQAANGALVPGGGTFVFPARSVDDLPISELFELCNDGLEPVSILAPESLVTGTGFHQIGDPPVAALAAGACTSFRVRFHTAHPDSYSGSVTIQQSGGAPYAFDLEGSALTGTQPEIRVELVATGETIPDGGSFTFPGTRLDALPISRLVAICNDGGSELMVNNPAALVSGSGFLEIGDPPASVVAPGACTTVRVRFHTATEGPHSGSLVIDNNDSNENPYEIDLAGIALPASAPSLVVRAVASGLELEPGDVFTFPATPYADLPTSRLFEVCNVGTADLLLTGAGTMVSGTGFQLLSAPTPQIVSGDCSPFRVRFHTAFAGSFSGTVSIRSNDPIVDPFSFVIEGEALQAPPPDIGVSMVATGTTLPNGSTFAFPDTYVADLPISRLLRVCNHGVGDLELHQPAGAVSGSGFQLLSAPDPVIVAGLCSDFRVRFHVAHSGAFGGSITLSSNDPDENPYVVDLAGTALPDLPPEIRVAQAATGMVLENGGSFAFPSTPAGQPISRLFEICNDGTGDLLIGNGGTLVSGGGFSQLSQPVDTILAGECTPFRVRFHHATPGSYSGAVLIDNNDDDEDPYVLTLEGTASF